MLQYSQTPNRVFTTSSLGAEVVAGAGNLSSGTHEISGPFLDNAVCRVGSTSCGCLRIEGPTLPPAGILHIDAGIPELQSLFSPSLCWSLRGSVSSSALPAGNISVAGGTVGHASKADAVHLAYIAGCCTVPGVRGCRGGSPFHQTMLPHFGFTPRGGAGYAGDAEEG